MRYWMTVILISKCRGIAVFSCGMRFFRNLDSIKSYPPGSPTFSEPFPVSNWTFPLKLNSRGNRKQEFPVGFDVRANSTGANLPGGEIGSYQRVATSLSSLLKVVTCDQEFFYSCLPPKLLLDAFSRL